MRKICFCILFVCLWGVTGLRGELHAAGPIQLVLAEDTSRAMSNGLPTLILSVLNTTAEPQNYVAGPIFTGEVHLVCDGKFYNLRHTSIWTALARGSIVVSNLILPPFASTVMQLNLGSEFITEEHFFSSAGDAAVNGSPQGPDKVLADRFRQFKKFEVYVKDTRRDIMSNRILVYRR